MICLFLRRRVPRISLWQQLIILILLFNSNKLSLLINYLREDRDCFRIQTGLEAMREKGMGRGREGVMQNVTRLKCRVKRNNNKKSI